LLSELSDHSERYRRLIITRDPETWALLKSDHRQLMERVKQGDGDATADLRVGHLMRTASRLIPVLDSTYSFDRLKALHHRLTTKRWPSDVPAPRT
jgi:DNA-binding GntR family transcriptional regulator